MKIEKCEKEDCAHKQTLEEIKEFLKYAPEYKEIIKNDCMWIDEPFINRIKINYICYEKND